MLRAWRILTSSCEEEETVSILIHDHELDLCGKISNWSSPMPGTSRHRSVLFFQRFQHRPLCPPLAVESTHSPVASKCLAKCWQNVAPLLQLPPKADGSLYQIAPSPATRIFSFTQEAAITSPLLQNLDFVQNSMSTGGEKKPTHRIKIIRKIFKQSHRKRGRRRSTWTKSNWSVFQRNPRTKNACKNF